MKIRWHKWKDRLLLVLAIGIVFFVAFCAEHAPRKRLEPVPTTALGTVGPHHIQQVKWGPTSSVYGSAVRLSVAGYPVAAEKKHVRRSHRHSYHVRVLHRHPSHHSSVQVKHKHHHKAHHAKHHSHQQSPAQGKVHYHGHGGHAKSFPAHPR